MKPLGVALIGCGAISDVHLRAIQEIEAARLVAVADIDSAATARAAGAYPCDAYADYRDMLAREDVDVVHICTGHYLHAPMAIDALQAGKHVLTEKPLAESRSAAQALLEAAAKAPHVQLGVISQNRYNPASQMMKSYCETGQLGSLLGMKGIVAWHRDSEYYRTEWKGNWATEGGGVLINQAIHTLDLLRWFGGECSSVKGSMSNDSLEGVIEVEDTVHAHLIFRSGATAIFYATNAHRANTPVEMELLFEKGTLSLKEERLTVCRDGETTLLVQPEGSGQGAKSYWGISHKVQIADFYRHILAGEPYWLHGGEGFRTLELVANIYASSRSGKRIGT